MGEQEMINLKLWNYTGDLDAHGLKTGEAKEYPATSHVTPNPDGSVTFLAHVDGAHTSGSKYPRSELREIKPDGSLAAWKLSDGGTMTATLRIDAIPTLKDGTPGKAVIGQIHGKNDELIRLYWNNGVINFHNDISGTDHKEHEFTFDGLPVIPLGKEFSYLIHAGPSLAVHIHLDGKLYIKTIDPLDPKWTSDSLYFKAGVYLGENASQGATGFGQVTFTALDYSHTPGQGLGGLPVAPAPVPVPPAPNPNDAVKAALLSIGAQIMELAKAIK
jgi:hypothetical protein